MKFNEIFIDDTKNIKRINSEEYISNGEISVIDQGKDLIAGYITNDIGNVCNETRIIFGDHTRILKYIDFPFVCGADGAKVLKIMDPDRFDYKYMYYYLLASNIPNTGYNRHFKWLKQLEFHPTIKEEQLKIVDELDKINKLIEIKKEEINKLDTLIKSQFVEMFENKKFEVESIKNITEVVTKGTTPSSIGYRFDDNGTVNFIKIESIDLSGNFIKDKFAHVTEKCDEKLKRSKLRKNDILFSIAGVIGRTAIVSDDILPANTNQALAIIRLNNEKVNVNFLNYMLNSEYVIKQYNKKKQGVAQINLSLNDISNLEVLIPPIELQNKFAQIVEQINKQKFEFEKSLKKLVELQASLMQEYFG